MKVAPTHHIACPMTLYLVPQTQQVRTVFVSAVADNSNAGIHRAAAIKRQDTENADTVLICFGSNGFDQSRHS